MREPLGSRHHPCLCFSFFPSFPSVVSTVAERPISKRFCLCGPCYRSVILSGGRRSRKACPEPCRRNLREAMLRSRPAARISDFPSPKTRMSRSAPLYYSPRPLSCGERLRPGAGEGEAFGRGLMVRTTPDGAISAIFLRAIQKTLLRAEAALQGYAELSLQAMPMALLRCCKGSPVQAANTPSARTLCSTSGHRHLLWQAKLYVDMGVR